MPQSEGYELVEEIAPAPSAELDRTIASPGGLSDIVPQLPQIEGYEVLEEIKRGGMGVVYRARQRAAGNRVVALKVMLGAAFASAADLRRFEREVEIASNLNHPNIARIYDSGQAHGRHYFAMEHIEGQALDKFCKSRNLPLKDRLRLFTAVCEAVAFAHRRGVIHRDLTPSNIIVNNKGIPYILDFGLAKTQSTSEDAEIRSMLTMDGLILGTLPYMAPEQAEGKVSAIDTRTDVYALGVILYELLTGKYPYEVTGQMAEVLKRIAESEPNRPSTVNRLIGDEVETIILRALQKLPDRRYSGADDLARDVVHYLAGEPIEAKRDSGWYVFRKTARRYRIPLAFAAVIIAFVAASAAVSFTFYRRAEAQRREAEKQRNIAQASEKATKIESAKNKQTVDFLRQMLTGVDPEQAKGRDTTLLREILDKAARRVGTDMKDQPEVQGCLSFVIGNTYRTLGLYTAAQSNLERSLEQNKRALGMNNLDTLASMEMLAMTYTEQGKLVEAENLLRQGMDAYKRLFGPEDTNTIGSACNLAILYRNMGKYAEAEKLLLPTLETAKRVLGERHRCTLTVAYTLAAIYWNQRKYAEAEKLLLPTLELGKRVLGVEHPDTLGMMECLAITYQGERRFAEAEKLLLKVFEIRKRVLGPEHPHTMNCMDNLVITYCEQKKYAEAEKLLLQTLEIRKRVVGTELPETLRTMKNLASVYTAQGAKEKASELLQAVREIESRTNSSNRIEKAILPDK